MIQRYFSILGAALLLAVFSPTPQASRADETPSDQVAPAPLPDDAVLRQWIAGMKVNPRGPFKRIRWFCKDGTVLPPRPYACGKHGGGIQHGEWADQILQLRNNGFLVANLLSEVDPEALLAGADPESVVKQLLLEKFLIEADDGWIFRQARFYRGALQDEDETAGGRRLLMTLAADPAWRDGRFLVLREAARLLPHGRETALLTELRQESRTLAEADPRFDPIRTKLHIRPEPADAEQVRGYASRIADPARADAYRRLADTIDAFFQPPPLTEAAAALIGTIPGPQLAGRFRKLATDLRPDRDLPARYTAVADLMVLLREQLSRAGSSRAMLDWLDFSLRLEQEAFQLGNQLLGRRSDATRREQLFWLRSGIRVAYGSGLLTRRQHDYLMDRMLSAETGGTLPLDLYRDLLGDLGRAPEWADRTLHFYFRGTVDRFQRLEPLAAQYFPDRLRGSPLLSCAQVLELLRTDLNVQLGLQHQVFGESLGEGVRGANPGLARGILQVVAPGSLPDEWDAEKIYLLPEVPADLPRVAGIISTGQGNVLSHVQLLARNLGIPNIVIAPRLWTKLAPHSGTPVILAVSPLGRILLEADSPQWAAALADERVADPGGRIQVPEERLDLKRRDLISLAELRAADAGRVAGPKAANLGELKSRYPGEVTEGLVIPFGRFRQLLEQPIELGGPSLWDWMRSRYRTIAETADPNQRRQEIRTTLQRIRERLLQIDPGPEFRANLRAEMTRLFGPDRTYGVFVRSDTNVEDLPGFSGAGLNLTVPNVVGFDQVLEAIHRVWASPFTERSFDWRQSKMDRPELVFTSILLMLSVPVEKSGVLVTADIRSDDPGWLTVAVNAGVGGAVAGQMAEQLLVNRTSGEVRLLAPAAEPIQRLLSPRGGVVKVPITTMGPLLSREEIDILRRFTATLPQRFPELKDAEGRPVAADVEFGFRAGRLALFQIRPFLNSPAARQSRFLTGLDRQVRSTAGKTVDLNKIPGGMT